MYHFVMSCMLLLLVNARGKSLQEENRLLEKSNHALVEALKTLTGFETELKVGGVPETLVGLPLAVCPTGQAMSQADCLNLPNEDSKYKSGGRADTWAGIGSGCFRNKDYTVFYNLKSPDTLYDPAHPLLCRDSSEIGYVHTYTYFMSANPPVEGGCEKLEAKGCTGTAMRINFYNRDSSSNAHFGSNTGDDWCLKQCEYLAINGCCQWDRDTDNCYFSFYGEVKDNDFHNRYLISEWGARPLVYNYNYQRYAGMCTFNGNYLMQLMENKKSGCEAGDMGAKTVSASSEVTCTAACIDDPRCNFATWNGVCRTFTQCTIYNLSDNGFKMWSKVNDDAPIDIY